MGNFTEDLAKGFIRSAVNQVGRDGGKVISNSIYGNAHSTPIRGIGKNTHNQFFDESTNEVISPEEYYIHIWYHEIFSKNSIHEEICFSCTICTR